MPLERRIHASPQTEKQREFEARIKRYGSELARRQGMTGRAFFKSATGMAAAFVAMNETYGPLFMVSRAEAATPEMADERARSLKNQFIMDMHTHFLRDDTRIQTFVNQRATVGQLGWNSTLKGKEQTLDDLKFANYFKEIFLDAVCTGAPQWRIEALRRLEIPEDMQKRYGFKPFGTADGPVKRMIFGETNAKLYKFSPQQRSEVLTDRVAKIKETYEQYGEGRSNLAYGYVAPKKG